MRCTSLTYLIFIFYIKSEKKGIQISTDTDTHIERESKYQSISDTMFLAHFQEFGYMVYRMNREWEYFNV